MELIDSAKRVLINMIYPTVPFCEKKPFRDYYVEIDNQQFAVFRPKNEKIVAANGDVVCTQLLHKNDSLYLYPDIQIPKRRYRITFDANTFPDLINNSHIQLVLLLPYILKTGNRTPKWRLVIITDRCQVYHNFPDGNKSKNAIISFEESLIWDLPGNKYPSLNEDCEGFEAYFPFLPESVYEYHPAGNTPRSFHVTYEDGREEELSRFYFPKRSAGTNPFVYLNGYEPDPLMSFIGTYCGNSSSDDSSRVVIFATHDGGKNWFAKYEFNDDGRSENYGNNICPVSLQGKESNNNSLYLCIRKLIRSDNDELAFRCGANLKIRAIKWNQTAEIDFEHKHGLESGNIVAIKGIENDAVENALTNNDFNDDSFGNGVFFKVRVIDDYSVQLYECVSRSRVNLPARHIHSINRIKDGFMIATGETYPQGWLMIASITDSDNWSNNMAWDEIPFIRLNSRRDSVQRIVGAVLLDNKDHEIVYASDCSSMKPIKVIEVDSIPTNQMGIYKGKVTDIDDFRYFELLEEIRESSFFFKELDGNYVFCGQRGEIAIGFDRGKSWRHAKLNEPLVHYMGRTKNYFVIDGKILRLK